MLSGMRTEWLALLWMAFSLAGGAMLSAIWDDYPYLREFLLPAYAIICVVTGAWILWLFIRTYWGGDQRRIVAEQLPTLDSQAIAWLRKMQSGARPVGVPTNTWGHLLSTGLVEGDFHGPKGIVAGFEPHIRRWLWFNQDGGRRKVIAGLLMAAGIVLFITGLVLYNSPIINVGPPQTVAADESLTPQLEQLRDGLRMNGMPLLGITTSPDGSRMTTAQVQLNLINAAPHALSYTVHQFEGEIGGVKMPDVAAPNYGGEVLPGEPRTYNGGVAAVNIGAGPFRGKVEWNIRYGIPGNEPFSFTRQATFTGVYNPQNHRGEQIHWTWLPPPQPVAKAP